MKNFYKDKIILVTGAAGSIGRTLVKKLIEFAPKAIRVLDIDETGLFELEYDLKPHKIRTLMGSVRDSKRMNWAVEDVDIVFHAAALKHVPLCEYNPFEAVQTNVEGTENLIKAALQEEVERFITISTDKAVSPINVMGASKLLAERLTISANHYKGSRKTKLSCVRFGNVLNSQGSVVPIFKVQMKKDGTVKVTDKRMTRFIMSRKNAVKLVLKASKRTKGEEIFILKMPALKITDLARAVIDEYAVKFGLDKKEVKIEYTGKTERRKIL